MQRFQAQTSWQRIYKLTTNVGLSPIRKEPKRHFIDSFNQQGLGTAQPMRSALERMPTRAAPEMTAHRVHLSPQAIASGGRLLIAMPMPCAPAMPRALRLAPQPGWPCARLLQPRGAPDHRGNAWKPMAAGGATAARSAAATTLQERTGNHRALLALMVRRVLLDIKFALNRCPL